jgi:hypothetical protein
MARWLFVGIATSLLVTLLPSLSPAQTTPSSPAGQSPPTDTSQAPTYDPTAGAIVNGLKGIIAGTKASIETYRSSKRFLAFRQALSTAMFTSNGKSPLTLAVTSDVILCEFRRTYADVTAEAAYLSSIVTGLDKFASPPKITTLGQAFLSLFNKYSIDVPAANLNSETSTVAADNCVKDLESWQNYYYNYNIPLPKVGPGTEFSLNVVPIDTFITDISSISALANALVAIVTPIAVTGTTALDSAQRNHTVDNYIYTYRGNLVKAARELAIVGTTLADANRFQAVGQFAEKMANVRQLSVDLSKINVGPTKKVCSEVVAKPITESGKISIVTNGNTPVGNATLHFATVPEWVVPGMRVYDQTIAGVIPANTTVLSKTQTTVVISADTSGVDRGTTVAVTYPMVSDEFVQCYAQAWQQISTAVSDAVNSASAYDAIADVSSDQVESAVNTIQKHMLELANPPEIGATDLLAAATQLLAFGQAIETALSPDNLNKVQTEVNAVAKQFGVSGK